MVFEDLKGKNALVVGVGGIGGAIASELWKNGMEVTIVDKKPLEELVNVWSEFGIEIDADKICYNQLDVTKKEYLDFLEKGDFDVFAYAAGVGEPTPIGKNNREVYNKLFNLNVLPFANSVDILAGKEKHPSSIIVISSINGYRSEHSMAGYDSTKAALIQYVKTASLELGRKGIRINAIAPGYIRTPQTIDEIKDGKTRETITSATPLGRIGEPEDVAHVATALASDYFGFVTGACYEVSGGLGIAQYSQIEKQTNLEVD